MHAVKLRNGVLMPSVGYGTWRTPNETVDGLVETAIRAGYRHLDTAAKYANESGVGAGIRACVEQGVVRREELFVTTKVWNADRGYGRTIKAFETSMQQLGLETLDLYLIHWPAASQQYDCWKALNAETWRALEDLYKAGRVRAIGICNFKPHHLLPLLDTCEIAPMVNQIEIHPGMTRTDEIAFCQEKGIMVQAWSPLGTGRMVENPQIQAISARYGRTPAQLCLRWLVQKGVVPLPKSWNAQRMADNLKLWDFEISAEDCAAIDAMPYFGGSGEDPDQVMF